VVLVGIGLRVVLVGLFVVSLGFLEEENVGLLEVALDGFFVVDVSGMGGAEKKFSLSISFFDFQNLDKPGG